MAAAARVLICDDEAGMRGMLEVLLHREGYAVQTAEGVEPARQLLGKSLPFDVIVTDLSMPDGSGMDVLRAARERDDATQVILITAYATTEQAVEAMRLGAYDYIQKPFKNHELLGTIEKALEKRAIVKENASLRVRVHEAQRTGELIGKYPPMLRIMELVRKVSKAPTSVLVTGESGTGKEIVARSLHELSDRNARSFIVVNCGALPENLMESELFGHEKGAFTGAVSKKEGLVRAADGGTLFLDEIGELPLALQVKLLRVLQERKVRAVGADEELAVDVRVVAATNRDLEAEVEAGRFRQDLFFRLNVIRVRLPPLRERREDIPLFAERLLQKHGLLQGKKLTISPEALRRLVSLPYPGNVRELENIIEHAVTLASGHVIELEDLPEHIGSVVSTPQSTLPEEGLDLDAHLQTIEESLLSAALERTSGNRTEAAKLLRMSFRSFRYRLAKYGMDDDEAQDAPAIDME